MSVLTLRLSYYPLQGNGNEVIIKDVTRIVIKRGLDNKSNTINIKLKNSIKKLLADGSVLHKYVNDSKQLSLDNTSELQQGDILKIWTRWSDSASDTITYDDSSSNLITISEVNEWDCIYEDNNTGIVLKGVDKTYEVLNKLWVQSYTTALGFTCPTMAQNVIRNSTDGISNIFGYDYSGNFVKPGLFGIDARIMTGTYTQQAALDVTAIGTIPAYMESNRIDNSVYPVFAMTKVWKPVYEWLKEINDIRNTNSSAEMTANAPIQDRNNRFYIDQKNRYHQFYPADTVNYTIIAGTVSSSGTTTSFKMTKKTFDVINMVIFNSGKDLDNVGILWYFYDRTSKERRLKMKYIPMLEIASEGNGSLRQAEADKGNITINADTTITIDVSVGTTAWGESYTSDADYKSKFRLYARTVGERRARALTLNRGNPRWKGNLTLKKGGSYNPGELIKLTALTHGINEQLVRIKDVTHQITPTQWLTQLEVEADEPKYGESI